MIIRSMNNQKEFPEGTTVQNCLKGLDAFPRGTLAALSGGIVCELNDPLRHDCSLTPLTLEHEEGRLRLANIANGPVFLAVAPGNAWASQLSGRCSAHGTGHGAVELAPRVGGVVEGLALSGHAGHEREVTTGRMAKGAYALGVDA
jgi:hypothetical protein